MSEEYSDSGLLPSETDLDANELAMATLRALVATREAGIIIGASGKTVANIRESTGVKAMVLAPVPGCSDRILKVSGSIGNVAAAIGLVAAALIEAPPAAGPQFPPLRQMLQKELVPGETTLVRLLVPNAHLGLLIGKDGLRIKLVQAEYGVNIVALKLFLPNLNERIVEVMGTAETIAAAVRVILTCLVNVLGQTNGVVLYVPSPRSTKMQHLPAAARPREETEELADAVHEELFFANDIVGLLIGRKGARIQEIRRALGTQIVIDNEPTPEGTRLFRVLGLPAGVDQAVAQLFAAQERELARRAEEEPVGEPDARGTQEE